jgi:hypothetical protein
MIRRWFRRRWFVRQLSSRRSSRTELQHFIRATRIRVVGSWGIVRLSDGWAVVMEAPVRFYVVQRGYVDYQEATDYCWEIALAEDVAKSFRNLKGVV